MSDATLAVLWSMTSVLEPHALAGQRDGDSFTIGALAADPVYVVAELGDQRWLVAWRRTWRWGGS